MDNYSQDELAIRKLLEELTEAFNKSDIEKLFSLHTDDVIVMEPNQPAIYGKQQLSELFKEFIAKNIVIQLDFKILELEIAGERAFVRGQVFKTVSENGYKPVNDTGKFITLLKKQPGGNWLRTHVIVNSDLPAEIPKT